MVKTILPARLSEATVRKGGKTILGPLDWELNGAGCTILLGPNGAGKTTLLRLMHGLERPKTGKVTWSGRGADLYRRQAFIFQTPVVLRRTVIENVIYPLRLRKIAKEEAIEAGLFWLEKVGLTSHAKADALSLSGGEKQKLALARAMIAEPEVMFLDEPTANLDGSSTQAIEVILQEALEAGVRLVMATHNLGQATRLATEVLFLNKGRIWENSDLTSFFEAPETEEAHSFLKGEIVI
ncbi:ATP-binding cassette domain-containing protein [Sneathiella limimaris]|uniref:ATP-binding cassette domain-containing protein n=1 Tax=Sneathiella limimaris TaxID=1964213 RepID=UPI00146BD484|nr:ATP-binding cassette domain-containing protein [Sneathiella limimaris]